MTWFKTDDKLAFHQKTLRAGNAAMGAWVRIGSWCSQYETDGFAPADIVHTIASDLERAALLTAGLLILCDDGRYEMHDFLKYNPSRAELDSKRNRWVEKRHVKRDAPGASPGDARGDAPGASGSGTGIRSEAETTESEGDSMTDQPVRLVGTRATDPAALQESSDVMAVLEHWALKLYPGRKPLFDDKRRKRVKARLREGFTVERLKLAIDGALKDDFLMGLKQGSPKNGYRDVSTVLRDAAQVERLIELAPKKAAPPPSRPRNDDHGPVDTGEATGVRKLVSAAPGAIALSAEDQAKRASDVARMMKAIGGGGVK